jgi:hypothetical protein
MELITFFLFTAGQGLFQAIIIFLMAIPTGLGLGIGLHAVKSFFARQRRKQTPSAEQRADNYKDFLSDLEVSTTGEAK